jgi:transposase
LGKDKKIARGNDWDIVWIDESGFMLQPVVRRTWAPCGETPIHYSWDRHDRISACAGIKVTPNFSEPQVFFALQMENLKAEQVVDYLKAVHQETQRNMIVIMDRWNGHRKAVRLLSEEGADWLKVEWLPAYAPELNPVELLWGHTKYADLANYIPEDIQIMRQTVTNSIQAAGEKADLLLSFVHHTKLDLQ